MKTTNDNFFIHELGQFDIKFVYSLIDVHEIEHRIVPINLS